MEYISSFTYCDSIQTEMTPHGPRHQIVNPLQVLAPIAVPGNYSFSIACHIAGFDTEKENSIEIKFLSPKKEVIYQTGDVKFQIPKEHIKTNEATVMQFNIDMRNIVLRECGLYDTVIYFNGNQLGNYKIQVIVGEQ